LVSAFFAYPRESNNLNATVRGTVAGEACRAEPSFSAKQKM